MDTTAIVPFTFDGDSLDVVRLPDGDVGVSIRRLCEAIGLNPDAQRKRLDRAAKEGLRWACTSMVTVQVEGQGRALAFLPRRSLPMWAATVDTGKARPEVRAKLVRYQDAAAEALAAAFLAPAAAAQSASEAKLDKLLDVVTQLCGAVAQMSAARALPPIRRAAPVASLPLPFQAPALAPPVEQLIPSGWVDTAGLGAALSYATGSTITSRKAGALLAQRPDIRNDRAMAISKRVDTKDAHGQPISVWKWFYNPSVVGILHALLAA